MKRASDLLLVCSTELRSRRLKARKATATTVMTESTSSVTTRATPRWHAGPPMHVSLTPRFSGVIAAGGVDETVSTVSCVETPGTAARCRKTVETVLIPCVRALTPLKRGVNERVSYCCATGLLTRHACEPSRQEGGVRKRSALFM